MLHSQEDAKEVVQEVFLSVWKHVDDLRDDGNLKGYLHTATYHKCLNYLNKNRLLQVPLEELTLVDPAYSAEGGNLEAAELKDLIFEEIGRLPETCRKVFLLSRQKELSYKEIADQLGIAPKTVENHIGRALKRLRLILENYENGR